jgi:tetratricopeptide (TPR) repeat protein
VAYFRLEAWDEALSALYRSMELRDEGDSTDWFFLAMIHRRLGHKERAREWFDKAVQWSRRYRPGDEELYRFEVEAAEALGLPKPERPPNPPARLKQEPYYPSPYSRGLRIRGDSYPPHGRSMVR